MRAKSELRDAQQRTIARLYEYDETQAVLPMGGGKTAAALTAFAEMQRDNIARDMFVLAPKRVAQLVWAAEAKQWEHLQYLRVQLVSGSEAQRLAALRQPADVYTIGVDNTQWFVEWAKAQSQSRFKGSVLCIDELSRFKNPRGKRGKALFPIVGWFLARWGLTGTPRPNGYEDQFMPMKLLTAGRLWGRSYDPWHMKYFFPVDFKGFTWAIHRELEPKIVADINTVTIALRPEDMPDLPELNDGPEFIRWVDMPEDVKPVYKKMQRHLIAEMRRGTIVANNMAVASGKLCQIIQGFLYDHQGQAPERLHDVKMEELHEMIEEAGGEPVAIAYHFQEDLARLQQEFPGIPYLGRSDAADVEFERGWNRGQFSKVALHPASAGHGLNLQFGGAQLFWYDMTWSAELYDQLIKRFHRPGQHRPVFSRPILMRGTVDELKYDRVRNKITNQDAFNRLLNEV